MKHRPANRVHEAVTEELPGHVERDLDLDSDTKVSEPGFVWWAKQILSYLLLFAVLAVLVAAVVVPRVSGATPYTILTSSMRPNYPPGSMVVIQSADPADLGVGTVITYQLESGKPDVVTHRIIATEQDGTGELSYVTRGDNNGAADEKPVRLEQIRGKLWYSVPYMGYVSQWMTGEQRKYAVAVIVVALLGYASFMFVGVGVEYRKKRKEVQLQ